MLLDLGAVYRSEAEVPVEWRGLVEKSGSGFTVRGDITAATDIFLADNGLLSDRVEDVLDRIDDGVAPSPFAISALLHSGLVPPPHSEFQGVYTLTMGDVVRVSWQSSEPHLTFEEDYPWLAGRSREDSEPSERRLLDLLTVATDRDLESAGGRGFLMLSSGKDSAAVALALAEAGHAEIPCVTYGAGADDPEPEVAADICRRLGLEHRVVTLPHDPQEIASTLTRFFTEAPRPGTDLKQIPYVLATAGAASPGGTVIDGGGNDSYMGYPVTGRWARKTQLRLRNRWLIDFVQRHTHVDSPINYVARSRFETVLSGRLVRIHESRDFYPNVVDTRKFWARKSKETAGMSLFDFYALSERYITPPTSMKKHALAATAIDHEASVPWCDHSIADYYFNLPEQYRFDRKHGVNKILLRRMLLQYLDYDAEKVGKHYFSFEGARFVAENREYIRSEIESCTLWDGKGLGTVRGWLDAIEGRPLLHHAILTIFMISGWHNHSRYGAATSERSLQGGHD
jgi:asparagine synthase (glutamine-hydrolysing)